MNSDISKDVVSRAQITQLQKLIERYKAVQPQGKLQKTVLIYYVYKYKHQTKKTEAKNQKILLNNIHTFAQYILESSLKINVKVSSESTKMTSYNLSSEEQQRSKTLINHKRLNVQEDSVYDMHSFSTNKQRVVILPVDKQLIDLIDKKQTAEISQQKEKSYSQFFKEKPKTQENQAQWKLSYSKITQQRVQKGKKLFNVIHQIDDLREYLLEKTQKVSLVAILGHKQDIKKETNSLLKLFKNIVSDDLLNPRLLVFYERVKCEEDDSGSDKQQKKTHLDQINSFLNQKNCCGVFSYNFQKKLSVKLLNVWDDKYFAQKSKVKFVLFSKLRYCESQSFQQCVQQLINNLKKTIKSVIQPIVQLYQIANQSLGNVSNPKKLTKFNQMHKQYRLDKLLFPKAQQLISYFTKNNIFVQKSTKVAVINQKANSLKEKAKEVLQTIKVPSALNNLVFIHCFNKLTQSILNRDSQNKLNTEKRLQHWKKGLKSIISLIASLFENIKQKKMPNTTKTSNQAASASQILIKKEQEKNSLVGIQIYQNTQKYFNFISFVFSYIEKIQCFLGEGSVFVDELKISFNSLVIKDDKIINFITQNQKLIRTNEDLVYYDILAYLIKTYKGENKKDNIQYIESHILQLKASEIAFNFTYDENRIIQAIQAYATVAIRFHELPQMKNNDLFNLFQIEQKIAKLLYILDLSQKAAEIYMHLKMFEKARKLFRQHSWHLYGERKAKKFIEWGKEFQNQLQFEIAIEFYKEAFENTTENEVKIEALKLRRACIVRQRKQETEEELRAIQKYLAEKDLFMFTDQQKLKQIFKGMQKLSWDKESECGKLV